MMKYLSLYLILFLPLSAEAVSFKNQFMKLLRESSSAGILYGHHDDTLYGYNWRYDNTDRSDTKDVVGMYPAMMSFDLADIEKGGSNRHLYNRMRNEIIKQHSRGGFITVSWHATNLLTGGNAWDTSKQGVVRALLSGGSHHEKFLSCLDSVAAFFQILTDESGQPIPIIFRPWHECNGTWFWWGTTCCSPDEYKALWNLTVRRLKKRKVENIIYVFSPGSNIRSESNYFKRYPGDKIISVLGVEGYAINATASEQDRQAFISKMRSMFDYVAPAAIQRKKLLALTETGTKHNSDISWWTQALLPAIEGYPINYLVMWRNATQDDNECYGPYKGSPSEPDFMQFTTDSNLIFIK